MLHICGALVPAGGVSGNTLLCDRQNLCQPLSSQQYPELGIATPATTAKTTDASMQPFRCQHCAITFECEECGGAMTPEQRSDLLQQYKDYYLQVLAARQARCLAAMEELKVQDTSTSRSRRKVHFHLDDLPAPVKDREVLYRDYQQRGKGLVQQWCSRLDALRGDGAEWWHELQAMVNRRSWSPQR